jgi:DNA/RNA-binding domain of Phe-tRNA-synthetase-like protein
MHAAFPLASGAPAELATRIRVDPGIIQRFPKFRLRVIYALGVTNGPSDRHSQTLLRESAAAAARSLGTLRIAEHPKIAAWRDVYREFGAKASDYPSSVEALLQRAAKGGPSAVPAINRLVDLYNAVSLRNLLPIGGEDLDRLQGDLVLQFAAGQEPFDVAEGGAEPPSFPRRGEVIWADSDGVTCRRWNWRQGRRTRLTESTANAYFVIEAMDGAPGESELEAATQQLCVLLRSAGSAKAVWSVQVV